MCCGRRDCRSLDINLWLSFLTVFLSYDQRTQFNHESRGHDSIWGLRIQAYKTRGKSLLGSEMEVCIQKNKTIDTSHKIITSWTLISGDFNKNPMEIGAWTSVSEHFCENLCWMYARACVQGTTLIMLNNLNSMTFVNLYNCAHLIPIYSIIQIRHLCTVYVWVTQLEATSLWVYSWIIV